MTFTIETETNNITAHADTQEAEAVTGSERFRSAAELAALATNWPAKRLTEIWNSLPGVTPVNRFKDQKTAVTRIWKAIQSLPQSSSPHKATVAARRPHNATTKGKSAGKASRDKRAHKGQKGAPVRAGSKKAAILALIHRPQGATLAELMRATGWQPHSIRGFISGAIGKKMGLRVESEKREDGERVYRFSN
jgi:hypothetical protein